MNQFEVEQKNQAKEYATDREYKDYLKEEFGNFNQSYADDDGVILSFERYYAKTALVGVSIEGFGEKKRFKTKIPSFIFEDFIGRLSGNRGRLEDLLGLQKSKSSKQNKQDEQRGSDNQERQNVEKEVEAQSAIMTEAVDGKDDSPKKEDQERDVKLLLEKERLVFEARRNYARTHFKAKGTYSRVKKILGEKFGKKPEDVPDVMEHYLVYQDKLKELREFKLNALKEKYTNLIGLPLEEKEQKTAELKKKLEELLIYFNYTEKLKLYEARTTAGVEAQEVNLGGKILKKGAEWVNAYRRLNLKKKLLISGALMVGGLGVTMIGATGVGLATMGALQFGQRMLGGAASGMGTAGLMETFARKNQKKQADKKTKALSDELDSIDEHNEFNGQVDEKSGWEEKFKLLEKKLDEEIETYAESLKNERGSVNARLITGLGVSAFVASGVPGYFLKWGIGLDSQHGNFHWLSDKLGITKPNVNINVEAIHTASTQNIVHSGSTMVKPENVKIIPTSTPTQPNVLPAGADVPANLSHNVSGSTGENLEHIFKSSKNIDTEKLVPGSVEKTFDGIKIRAGGAKGITDVDVRSGDNIEKVLIKKITDAQGMNLDKIEAEKLAHRMALQYVKEKGISFEKLNHIRIGDKIKFDLKHQKIIELKRASDIHGHIHISHEPKFSGNHYPQVKVANGVAGVHEVKTGTYATSDIEKIKVNPQNHIESVMLAKPSTPAFIDSVECQKEIIRAEGLKKLAEEAYKRANFFDKYNFTGARDALDVANGKYETMYKNIFRKIAGDAFSDSGVKGGLEGLKKIKAIDFITTNAKSNSKFNQLLEYAQTHFGEKATQIKSGETMSSWTNRVIGKIMESKGVEFDPYANKIYDVSK
jgi:hypothetical protein